MQMLLLLHFLLVAVAAAATPSLSQTTTYLLPPDAVSLLSFKSKADLDNKLLYTLNERFDYCEWQGVKCVQGRVVRFVLQGFSLRGTFAPNTLSRLDQLRVLSLQNNSLSGPFPDLSPLLNLKSLFLGHNSFSGSFPPSILLLHRLNVLDLSYNNLTGHIPVQLSALDRLSSLRLERNHFNGSLPPLNQSFLIFFNVSGNNLTGPIPVTSTLSKFDTSSFSLNPDLCGEIINKACTRTRSPFFDSPSSSNATSPTATLGQSAQAEGGVGVVVLSPPSPQKHKRTTAILGFAVGVSVLIVSLLCIFFVLLKKQSKQANSQEKQLAATTSATEAANSIHTNSTGDAQAFREYGEAIVNSETRGIEVQQMRRAEKSGILVFCGGNTQIYTLEQLMRASAELLGRGSIGTTYKAVLDNHLIVTVKRLDASKTAITSSVAFEGHMEAVGGLRHPNLVPIMAYFQAKGERLVIYDYQPNGSLFNLIHGSRSTRAKPLHWTSCLKIAEDVAQGLAYIHQASKLVHGNLKSSNILLGADFEACITDYCLAALADASTEDPDSTACKAPEIRKSSHRATAKTDVYAFGVLLLELLTGKHPSHHPFLAPADMLDWVRAVREDDGAEDNQLGMLTEVASVCSLTSPEQRPAMWQVLKMIHEIKESAMVEDNTAAGYS
ncbi:hypothetical protein P3X46_018747 [Hevea brasiliensis]|uniref:Protein kinase domain-containing protein n=1 Tax=Hevea brasiliensis TaxID=3981 RepID=A0ABQ9LT15_HEVBR|nr:probable inactive receptor kinase At5g67200 [Hevea brasiliensis]KAJ9170655.1 hypothetical protein P3X46_018747 [Hevea brasiliensis]